MSKFESNEDIQAIISKCRDSERMEKVLDFTASLIKEGNLVIEGYRWQSLANHVAAMVDRSVEKEVYDGIDIGLFNEISVESIDMAEKVVNFISGLDEKEKYLLSVHFETAKIG